MSSSPGMPVEIRAGEDEAARAGFEWGTIKVAMLPTAANSRNAARIQSLQVRRAETLNRLAWLQTPLRYCRNVDGKDADDRGGLNTAPALGSGVRWPDGLATRLKYAI